MDHYLHTRRPIIIYETNPKEPEKKETDERIKPQPSHLKIIAPLNTNLTGWKNLAKRC